MTDHFMFCRLVMFFSPFMHRSKDFKGIFSQGKSGCQWSYRLLQKYQGWVERFKGKKWIFGWRGDPLCRPRLLFFPSWVAGMLGWDWMGYTLGYTTSKVLWKGFFAFVKFDRVSYQIVCDQQAAEAGEQFFRRWPNFLSNFEQTTRFSFCRKFWQFSSSFQNLLLCRVCDSLLLPSTAAASLPPDLTAEHLLQRFVATLSNGVHVRVFFNMLHNVALNWC